MPQPVKKIVCCSVNETEYCLEMSAVSGIGRSSQITPDQTAAGQLGWLSIRQNKLPVFSMAERLNPAQAGRAAKHQVQTDLQQGFLVLLNSAQPFALKVDRVTGIIAVNDHQIVPLPMIIEPQTDKVFKGIVNLAEKWLLLADPVRLHPDNESQVAENLVPAIEAAPAKSEAIKPTISGQSTRSQILLFSSALKTSETHDHFPMVFGLSIAQVREILNVPPMMTIPGAPGYVVGITNWRNFPVPIIDLKVRLGITEAVIAPNMLSPKSRLLIVQSPKQAGLVGFLINSEVKAFPLPIPYQANNHQFLVDQELIKGVFDLEGAPLIIPDLDALLTRNFIPHPYLLS